MHICHGVVFIIFIHNFLDSLNPMTFIFPKSNLHVPKTKNPIVLTSGFLMATQLLSLNPVALCMCQCSYFHYKCSYGFYIIDFYNAAWSPMIFVPHKLYFLQTLLCATFLQGFHNVLDSSKPTFSNFTHLSSFSLVDASESFSMTHFFYDQGIRLHLPQGLTHISYS